MGRAPVGMAWCGSFPPLPPAVAQVLDRLPERRDPAEVAVAAGGLLWLPRLGVVVFPQERLPEGWLCTLAGADSGAVRLPSGIFSVSDREIATAVTARDLVWPLGMSRGAPDLDTDTYLAAWRVRLAVVEGSWLRVGEAIAAAADRESLTVRWRDPRLGARAGCRGEVGFRALTGRLRDAGCLLACFDDTTPEPQRRWGLRLPAPSWPSAC